VYLAVIDFIILVEDELLQLLSLLSQLLLLRMRSSLCTASTS
jgi:hypothetical protein